jgi:hypothetical protein
MADKKKKPKKKPDRRSSRPRDPNQLALWVVQQSTSCPIEDQQSDKSQETGKDKD